MIAHVLEMRGPPDKGIAWLRSTQPVWIANAGFRVHLAWHLALFQLDADAAADALATYDELIAPRLDGGNNGLVDASALLWRLQLRGAGSRRRWHDVVRLWLRERVFGNRAFDLVHAVIAFAGITLPNDGSVALHRSVGFELIGVFKAVGRKFGKWHDVAWYQRTLRESPPFE